MAFEPISVVIAAHDEALVVGRTLDVLLRDAAAGELDVTVAANGCSDDTAAVARSRSGVRVLELAEPGKVGALNAADARAVGFPRLYLDADIPVTAHEVRTLAGALAPGTLAATGRREVETTGRPWPVRAYYTISSELGWFDGHLYGRGAVMLSAEGRGRFGEFPPVLSDDLFLDQLFGAEEKVQVDQVVCRVAAPYATRALLRRLVRVKSGNAALRRTAGAAAGAPHGLREVVTACAGVVHRSPHLGPAALVYLLVTGYVALRAKARRGPVAWGQDRSTRAVGGASA